MEEKIDELHSPEAFSDKAYPENDIEVEKLLNVFQKTLGVRPVDASQYSPLALAYMGDSVYELLIRTRVVSEANMQVNKLNKRGSALAMAKTQARLAELLDQELTEEERHWIQRGKNAKVVNIPKSCTAHEYHMATGFECLLGFLYLDGQLFRILELVRKAWELLEKEV